jgi:hypothetical protein
MHRAQSVADVSVTPTAASLVCRSFLRTAGCVQVLALLKEAAGSQLTAEQLRDALQRHLPDNMQLMACRLLPLAAEPAAAAAAAQATAGVWCQPAAFLAAKPAGSPQELTLHVPQQLLAATAAAGRGVRIVVSDGGTSAAVLDRSIRVGDAAWPGDGALRLQLPPCQGPLVLLHLLSTAPAGAAQHAADELLGTAALLALPSAPACSEVNSMFDRMQQEVQAQAQGADDAPSAAAHVFNHQLREFVMDCVQLLAPDSSPEEQDLARHMQTFLALHGMRACLQLQRAAGVHLRVQTAETQAAKDLPRDGVDLSCEVEVAHSPGEQPPLPHHAHPPSCTVAGVSLGQTSGGIQLKPPATPTAACIGAVISVNSCPPAALTGSVAG